MTKYIFAYLNVLGGFFGQPFFADQKDIVPLLRQGLYAAKKEELEALKEDELHYLGEFDNESGVIKPVNEFVTSMSVLASEVLVRKFGEVDDHVKS